MKIEVDIDLSDEIAREWLEDIVRLSEYDYDFEEDREFLEEMGSLAERLLRMNWGYLYGADADED